MQRRLSTASAIALVLAMLLLGACDASLSGTPLAQATPIVFTFANRDHTGAMAVSGRDGTQLWRAEIGHGNWAPTLAGGVLFSCVIDLQGRTQNVVAVRVSDGKVLWRTSLPSNYFNYVLSADTATVAVDADINGLFALDATTGAIRWHRAGVSNGRPTVRDGAVYALYATAPSALMQWTAFRATDGAQLWRVSYAGFGRTEATATALFSSDGADVTAISRQDGKLLWADTKPGQVLAATDKIVLVGAPGLIALDPNSGSTLWTATTAFDAPDQFGTLPLGDGYVYGLRDGCVSAIRTSDGTEAWHVKFGSNSVGGLFVEGGVVFALLLKPSSNFNIFPCTQDCTTLITALNGKTGEAYWQRDASDAQLMAVRGVAE